jgi:large subunit ribosomal protein L3
MSKGHKPVSGSRGFWPKKRAKRIYPSVGSTGKPAGDKIAPVAFAGYKAGMTQVAYTDSKKGSATHGQRVFEAATVIDCPPLLVCGIKMYTKDHAGLINEGTVWAEKLPKDLGRKLSVPKKPHMNKELAGKKLDKLVEVRIIVCTKPSESGHSKKKPEVFEIPVSGDVEKQWAYALEKLGHEITPADVFSPGEKIDVRAVTTGKGYQGPVKRFGVKVRSRKNKTKMRHVGTLGPYHPARVLPGALAVPGQLGFQTRTEYNKKILKIDDAGIQPRGGFSSYGKVPKGYIILEGTVPGPKKRLIMLKKATRSHGATPQPVPLDAVSIEPQQ